ncbi:probable RNA-directed DNA polymerase from transposon X-element, partial [Nephila pilipes]
SAQNRRSSNKKSSKLPEKLQNWLPKWRIAINTEKSSAIILKKGRLRRRQHPIPLTQFNGTIPWTKETKYLEVILDHNLKYNEHINYIAKNFKTKLAQLIPLLRKSSKLTLENKRLIYLQYIQPLLSYACAIWGTTSQTNINKLQAIQNRGLRLITGAPLFIPRRLLHNELEIESIPKLIRKLDTSFHNSLQNHQNPTINCLSRYTLHTGTRSLVLQTKDIPDNL